MVNSALSTDLIPMESLCQDELPVWSIEGYEGRILKWEANAWRPYEYRNYRHWFSAEQEISPLDVTALRRAFGIAVEKLSDSDLVRTSPADLPRLTTRAGELKHD